MGKGFRWPVDMQAKDLGEIIEQACRRLVGRLAPLSSRLQALIQLVESPRPTGCHSQ